MEMSTVSTPEMAALLGISRQRVNELARLGKIDREPDGRWNPERVRAALADNLDPRQSTVMRTGNRAVVPESAGSSQPAPAVQKLPPAGESPDQVTGTHLGGDSVPARPGTQAYEQYLFTKEKRLKATLERQEAERSLIRVAEVEKIWSDAAIKFRDGVLGLATRVCDQLPDEWRREVSRVMDGEARKLLTELSDEVRNQQAA